MARKPIPDAELERFLAEPLVAVLATHAKTGRILLSPVWHEWRDGGFNVVIGADDTKARSLQHDPQASLVVAQHDVPYAGVEIRTEARLVEEGAQELLHRLAVRYLGERGAEAYLRETGDDPMVIVRLEGGTLRSWDYADEF